MQVDYVKELSYHMYQKACSVVPGGVHSPVRNFGAVSGAPLFIDHAKGAFLYDVDGEAYLDYVGSWGPMILGHAHPEVVSAVKKAIDNGLSYGAPCKMALCLSELICQAIPSVEKIRFVNSGTEATMSALRLARGFTGKNKVIKFIGCYHGHADPFLVQAGSGAATFQKPSSAGVPDCVTQHTLLAHYNDLEAVERLFNEHALDIAAIIVEPIAGNMGMITPKEGFLAGLRNICYKHDALLIFDEVMTGFRVAWQGAQGLFDIKPDITTYGKIIGGGMPVGALGGRADIMDMLAPLGSVYQAGTLSANPIAMTAGYTTLKLLQQKGVYESLSQRTSQFIHGINRLAEQHAIPVIANHVGSMFGLFFTQKQDVSNYADLSDMRTDLFSRFFHGLFQHNIYWAPSAYEAGFISLSHSEEHISISLKAFESIFVQLKEVIA